MGNLPQDLPMADPIQISAYIICKDERDFLAQELADCRAALEVEDLALVQEAVERLDVAGQRIGELIYAAADQSAGGSTEPIG